MERRCFIRILLVITTVVSVVRSEPVRSCLSEEIFQRSSCEDIREHVVGNWTEVRRLKLPFAMYDDEDCVTWQVSVNETNVKFKMQALIDGKPVKGMDPAFLTLNTHHETGICSVSMYLTIPKSNKTISIKDWWITFDDKRQVMVGYVCIKNHNQQQVNDGFPFKNLIFIYRKRQDEQVRSNIQEIVARLSAELEETSESYKELENDKCDGV